MVWTCKTERRRPYNPESNADGGSREEKKRVAKKNYG